MFWVGFAGICVSVAVAVFLLSKKIMEETKND
jgi:hypothetical protein